MLGMLLCNLFDASAAAAILGQHSTGAPRSSGEALGAAFLVFPGVVGDAAAQNAAAVRVFEMVRVAAVLRAVAVLL
jgi:hypothetical protein